MTVPAINASRSPLVAAGADFLSAGALVAWEAGSLDRVTALVERFVSGQIDASALRASLGTRERIPSQSMKGTAVVPLVGPISPSDSLFTIFGFGTSLRDFGRQLRTAAADSSVTSIVILTDSPGGFVGMVPETAALVRSIRQQKPVVAAVAGLNASAAYWITSNATAIEATPSADVGSIGVLTVRVSLARQLDAQGIDVHQISAGRFKGEGNPALPMTQAERDATQDRVDDMYARFVSDVAAGRKVHVSTVRSGFGEGRVVNAARALDLQMIDRVSTVEDTIARVVREPGSVVARVSSDEQRDRDLRRSLGLPTAPMAPTRQTGSPLDRFRLV